MSHGPRPHLSGPHLGEERDIGDALVGIVTTGTAHDAASVAQRLGIADRLVQDLPRVYWPQRRAAHERTVAEAHAALGRDAFAAAYDAGRALTLDSARAEALAVAAAIASHA